MKTLLLILILFSICSCSFSYNTYRDCDNKVHKEKIKNPKPEWRMGY